VADYLPSGADGDRVRSIMTRAADLLAGHEVNAVRSDLGENAATHIWLWGQGRVKPLVTLQEKFGLRSASIAAVDLIRGITRLLGCDQIAVEGATGFLDTNYAGKGAAAVAALDDYDLVIVHIEAPDEAGHLGDMSAKIEAIEQVDRHVVGSGADETAHVRQMAHPHRPRSPHPGQHPNAHQHPPTVLRGGHGDQRIQRERIQ
jgi:2,3-bisphosphoglycerate-independent phosphoglycerate mutase